MYKTIALALTLFLIAATAPPAAVAQEPHVTNVLVFDVGPDLARFMELSKRVKGINDKYGSTGKARIWVAAFAGPDSGRVIVAVEYPSMASMAQSQEKLNSSPEWRQLVTEVQQTTAIKQLSNSVVIELQQ